jgi:hypothetical protein
VVAVLGPAGRAHAQETSPADRPNGVLPAVGGVVAAGGMFVMYRTAMLAKRRDPSCADFSGGCTRMGLGGGLLAQAGGATIAYWAWKLGEADARDDGAGGYKDVSGYKLGGLLVGGVGLLAFYGAALYAGVGDLGCVEPGSPPDKPCLSRAKYKPTLIQLGATGALALAAPFAGYGFGYATTESKAKARAGSAMLLPNVVPGGLGLSLTARY